MQPVAAHNPGTRAVVAPGNYDGVHRGHQALITQARQMAARLGLRTRVLTFDPHPAALLAPDRAPPRLTSLSRRRELLLAHGVDEVEIAEFTPEYAAQSPTRFLERLISGGAAGFVVGHDFRFGRHAAGTVELLQALGRARGFSVRVVPPVFEHDVRISSSAVRLALTEGRVEEAAGLLGHVHDVTGIVVEGDRRGRALGFPTANIHCEPVLRPADGVYAVAVRRLSDPAPSLLRGVANLGTRPTFEAGRSLEVHLLDFEGSMYGESLRVGFVARLRGEQRFDGIEPLRLQIRRDCDAAKAALATSDQGKLSWI